MERIRVCTGEYTFGMGLPGELSKNRGPARLEAIVRAATELVVEVGYERVTVDAIAARAHASKATMYRRWPTKAALMADVLRRQAEGPGRVEVLDTGSLREDLLGQVGLLVASIAGGGGPSLLHPVEAVRTDPDFRALVRSQISAASVEVGETIHRQVTARGERVRGLDVSTVLDIAVAQVLTASLLSGGAPSERDQQRLVDAVLLPLLDPVPDRPA